LTPDARSRRLVRWVWLFRAAAFLCCALLISADVRSNSSFGSLRFNHQNGINAAIAVCTWHSVSSRFFPPKLLAQPRQEQVAHATQDQVAFQTLVAPALVLVQADLALLILKTTLDVPAIMPSKSEVGWPGSG
jgi:hypothetical protein